MAKIIFHKDNSFSLIDFHLQGQHDQQTHGSWAKGREQFAPGTKEAAVMLLLDSVAKGGKYDQPKSTAEVRAFLDELQATTLKDPNPAAREYAKAAEKAWTVWARERTATDAAEAAYRKAVEDPEPPEQLFNKDYARQVKARQIELATSRLTTRDWVAQHPEYELQEAYTSQDEPWLADAKTGEPISQARMRKLAREYIETNEARAEEILARSDVYVRVEPKALTRLLQDARMRTYHEEEGQETSISNHEGGNTPEMRKAIEDAYFGGLTYPVYGYMSDDPNGFVDAAPSHPLASVEAGLSFYGDIAIRLKPEVRERTTYTLGDSAALFGGEPIVSPQPVNEPSSLAGAHIVDLENSTTIREATINNFGISPYWEAQIHGGIHLSDIESIAFAYPPPPAVQLILEGRGIEWYSISTEQGTGYTEEEYGLTAAATNPYIASWNRLMRFHLAGQHDQETHGSWAGIDEDNPADIVRKPSSPEYRKIVDHSLSAITKVHDVPRIPEVSVEVYGALMDPETGLSVKGRYRGNEIWLLSQGGADEITFVHEFGHHLDKHLGLLKDENLLNALKKSNAVEVIKNAPNRTRPNAKKLIDYLSRDEEVLARAYSQWIAIESGDSKLTDQISKIGYPAFWSTEEYSEKIKPAFDAFFKGRVNESHR